MANDPEFEGLTASGGVTMPAGVYDREPGEFYIGDPVQVEVPRGGLRFFPPCSAVRGGISYPDPSRWKAPTRRERLTWKVQAQRRRIARPILALARWVADEHTPEINDGDWDW